MIKAPLSLCICDFRLLGRTIGICLLGYVPGSFERANSFNSGPTCTVRQHGRQVSL
jgi:hypothetical protein